MTRARSSSAKRSDSGQGNIKNFFGKKAGGEDAGAKEAAEVAANGDAAEPKAKSPGQSPGKTSDYESEASRSATPSGQASPGEETNGSKPAENGAQPADAGKTAADPQQGSPVVVKREIKTEEEDGDDEGADVFSQATAGADEEGEEEVEDESKVKAALQTGLLGKEVAEEERRMAAESRRYLFPLILVRYITPIVKVGSARGGKEEAGVGEGGRGDVDQAGLPSSILSYCRSL